MREGNNRNWIVALIGILVTVGLTFFGGWVQVNNRISVLEVEVKYQHQIYNQNSAKMDGLIQSVNDIKQNLVEMRGDMKLKADKHLVN